MSKYIDPGLTGQYFDDSVCILAGNISPIDVISHLPVMCEDHQISYVFVPSKEELGAAGNTKRPTSCVLVKAGDAHKETFDKVVKEVGSLN